MNPMKSLARFAVLCLASVAACSHAAAPDPALIGCWRAVKIVLHEPDGSKMEDASGRCSLQFQEDRFESACGTTHGTAVTTYTYQIVGPNLYRATMASSTFRTSLVGSTHDYEYHVDGDRLVTVTHPQAQSPAGSTATPRVESEATKMPCP